MKNKKAEQVAAKQNHRQQLKIKRRTEPDLKRIAAALIEKPSILIVCEGENTEPSYFNQFRIYSATVKSVGEGYNTIELLDGIDTKNKKKRVDLAIIKAERIYNQFNHSNHSNPAQEESSTTVFKLVKELLKYV